MLTPSASHPDKSLWNREIKLGDTLTWSIILAWQRVSTGVPHKFVVFGIKDNGDYICQNTSWMVFEIVRIWESQRYELNKMDRWVGVWVYYGIFDVVDIEWDHVWYISDLPIPDKLDNIVNPIQWALHIVDTTSHQVDWCIWANEEHISKMNPNLDHLWELYVWMRISGVIERPSKKQEKIDYTIKRVWFRTIALTRDVYNPKTYERRTKEYILSKIRFFEADDVIGEVNSSEGVFKWILRFSVKPSSSIKDTCRWVIRGVTRVTRTFR